MPGARRNTNDDNEALQDGLLSSSFGSCPYVRRANVHVPEMERVLSHGVRVLYRVKLFISASTRYDRRIYPETHSGRGIQPVNSSAG